MFRMLTLDRTRTPARPDSSRAARRGVRPAFEPLEGRQLLASSGLSNFFSGFFPTFSSPTTNNPTNKQLHKLLTKPTSETYPTFDITVQVNQQSDPGGTGVVFNNKILVEGIAQPYSTVWLALGPRGFFNNVVRADGSGYYIFTTTIPQGRTTEVRTFAESPALAVSRIATTRVTAADPIVSWDAIARRAIRNQSLSAAEAARDLAILHTAQYDAVAAATGSPATFGVKVAPIAGASPAAAANSAAAGILASLFPYQAGAFTTALAASEKGTGDTAALRDGAALGQAVAQQTLLARADDGAAAATAATAATGPDASVPPDFARVEPFALGSPSSFRPAAPPSPGTTAFDQALAEVAALGRSDSATRTPDQTQAATFWANGAGQDTDPAHWNAIAEEQATVRRAGLAATARLFAGLDVALADTAIAAADARDAYPVPRPATLIQSNDLTWRPLFAAPATSAYPSEEAAYGAAAGRVLGNFFGASTPFGTVTNATASQSTTDATAPQSIRTYPNFAAAGVEDGVSRIDAGDDYRFAVDAGANLGGEVAGAALSRFPGGSK